MWERNKAWRHKSYNAVTGRRTVSNRYTLNCVSLYDAVGIWDHTSSNGRVHGKERLLNYRSWPDSKYYPGKYLERLTETTKCRCSIWESKPAPPIYKSISMLLHHTMLSGVVLTTAAMPQVMDWTCPVRWTTSCDTSAAPQNSSVIRRLSGSCLD